MKPIVVSRFLFLSLALALVTVASTPAQEQPSKKFSSAVLGRWDMTVQSPSGAYPSWFEITKSGHNTLVGGYVGQFGSVRPISKIEATSAGFTFAVPPQWEKRKSDVEVTGQLDGDVLRGEVTDDQGNKLSWVARRAPALDEEPKLDWAEPIDLLKAEKLTSFQARAADGKHGWQMTEGALINAKPGQDLLTKEKFGDFKLAAEFRYPQGSNSGIYLRGHYEFQIEDNFGSPPDSHKIGGIYGFLTPSFNAAKPAGQWQTVELTLIGRRVTAVLNGRRILDNQLIPGITGGALDSNEGQSGPLMLQGDHGPVEFRKLVVTPART